MDDKREGECPTGIEVSSPEEELLTTRIKEKILGWLKRPGLNYLGDSSNCAVLRQPVPFGPEWPEEPPKPASIGEWFRRKIGRYLRREERVSPSGISRVMVDLRDQRMRDELISKIRVLENTGNKKGTIFLGGRFTSFIDHKTQQRVQSSLGLSMRVLLPHFAVKEAKVAFNLELPGEGEPSYRIEEIFPDPNAGNNSSAGGRATITDLEFFDQVLESPGIVR